MYNKAWSFSFKYHHQSKILKYILYIQSKDEESFVKIVFLMSFDLHCNGKNSFHSHLVNMSEYFKLPDFNPDLLDIAMVKSYVSSMKQENISYWQNSFQHSRRWSILRWPVPIWLCFWFPFFRMKDSTDFYDFWHTK